jgi:uncharacterized membrane protein
MTKEKEPPASDTGGSQDLEPLQEALEKLPQEKQQIILERFYSGPVMPPAMLAEVEGIIPGGANRILQITEKEQAHRHKVEATQMETYAWQAKVSLVGGLLAFVFLLAGIIFCAANGYAWGVASLATLGAFGVISHIIRIPSRNRQ